MYYKITEINILNQSSVEPWYNEGPRDWQNMFAISRFPLLLLGQRILFCYTSLYRGSLNQGSIVSNPYCDTKYSTKIIFNEETANYATTHKLNINTVKSHWIPKVTSPFKFRFSRQKELLLSGSHYFWIMIKKHLYGNSHFRQSGNNTKLKVPLVCS